MPRILSAISLQIDKPLVEKDKHAHTHAHTLIHVHTFACPHTQKQHFVTLELNLFYKIFLTQNLFGIRNCRILRLFESLKGIAEVPS